LVAQIVEDRGFVDRGEGPRRIRKPPAGKVQAIVSVGAQGAKRETTNVLRIEKLVDQAGFPALFVDHTIGGQTGG